MALRWSSALTVALNLLLIINQSESAPQAFRRDPGHPQWHHGAFHDVRDTIRSEVRRLLHTRAEVPFHVPLEVNVVLIGFQADGGYRYTVDSQKLEEFLRVSFPTHRPLCQETGEHLDIEHNIVYNTFHAGQAEFIVLEKSLKEAMVLAGTAREADYGRELPLFEVEATVVEPVFHNLYAYLFDVDNVRYSAGEMDRPMPTAIFIVNFDKVRMDPRNKEIDHNGLMYGKITQLTEEDMKKQEGEYIYRYRYNGGGASQVWLGSGRFAVIDLSAGPCTYGKIETEEGSVSSRTLPRLQHMIFPGGFGPATGHSTSDIFIGQLASLISTTIEHVIAPDVRFEIVDQTTRLLVPIIVLQNHNRYNILEKGHNYSINIEAIEAELKKMVHDGHEVVMVGGSHSLHRHEKLSIAVSKAMRGHSLQETKNDGRFHVHTRTFLDGAILKEEMERSADVLAAGLLEVADPSLSSKYFLRQHWMDDSEGSSDSILKHKPLWASYDSKRGKKKKKIEKKQGDLTRTYGTRVIPVFVLSLADVDAQLMMEDGSLVWTSNDVVIVLEHQSEKIPLSYVSETERRHVVPSQAQRHILAGLASAVGGLSAPYEKASHVHERPVVNWLWATGCHPFGPFSNTSQISQILQDVALRNTIYARVDSALHRIRETSEAVEAFAAEHLKTPLGEPVKGKKNKTTTELWLEKFYKKTTNLPEPFPHELVERLEKYLDSLEEQLVDLSSLLYDHRLQDANYNSSAILQSSIFTQQYVEHVLSNEREKMRCCEIVYKYPVQSSQTYIYGGILLAGFFVYFLLTVRHSQSQSTEREMEGIEHRTVNVNGINMHIAEKGQGPVILFIHGFPELWYTWRHQIIALASQGYRAVAPDLRGYGDTDAPPSITSYTCFHVVGDLIALLDAVAPDQDKVFVVGHDWGALIAWYLCLFRPDRVKALVNMSVVLSPRNPQRKPLDSLRAIYGNDYYICRFQEPGEIEAEFAQLGTATVLKEFLTYRNPGPLFLPKGKGFGHPPGAPIVLPSWLSEEDVNYYAGKFEKTGFTSGVNYYRDLDLNWELAAPWTVAQIKVPVKFIVGDLDLTYNSLGTKDYIHKGGFKRDVPLLEEVIVLEDVGHFLHEEKPDEINKHIYDFFQKF